MPLSKSVDNRRRLLTDIGRRSAASTWVYAIAWPFIFLSTELVDRFPLACWLLFAFFVVSALIRVWHFRLLDKLPDHSLSTWQLGLFPLSLLSILIWASIAGYALLHGATDLVFLMTISTVGFTAGGVNNFAPHLPLCRAFIFCGVGPLLVATLVGDHSIAFLIIVLMFISYLLLASRHQHGEYWRQLASETELKTQREQLERLSRVDSLTGLYNRRHLNAKLDEFWSLCARQQQPLSMLMLDIDHFKPINDQHGHAVGDACLQWLSNLLQRRMHRNSDVLTRMGGEEFAILLPFTDEQGAMQLAEIVRQQIAVTPFQHQAVTLNITVSIGIATCIPQPQHEMADLMLAADKALYKSKHLGRNRSTVARDDADVAEFPQARGR